MKLLNIKIKKKNFHKIENTKVKKQVSPKEIIEKVRVNPHKRVKVQKTLADVRKAKRYSRG